MNNIKRNILIYLDSYPMVVSLPLEQRGLLFTALMVYGDRLSRDMETELDDILDQFPQLTMEAKAVCGFMAGNILRDTQKWLNRQQSRQQYKNGGTASTPPASNRRYPAPIPAEEKARTVREDMERTRRLMDQLRGEG